MFKRGYIFAGLSVAGLLIACGGDDSSSSSSGGVPDFNTLKTELTVPTGTMAAGEEGAVADGLSKSQESQSGSPFGGVGTSSLKPQAACNEGSFQGGQSGTCDCPGGGSITFDLSGMQQAQQQQQGGNVNYTVSYSANACVDDGQTMDGSVYWHYEGNTQTPQDAFFIYAIHLSLSGKRTARYDIDYLYQNGKVVFKVDVKDGSVLVSAEGNWNRETKTGSFTVKDKNETWTCTAENGKGECKSEKGTVRSFG